MFNGPTNLRKFLWRTVDKSCSKDPYFLRHKTLFIWGCVYLWICCLLTICPMIFSILLTFFFRRRRPKNITGAVAGNLRFHHKKTVWSKTILTHLFRWLSCDRNQRLNTGMAPSCNWMIKIVKVNELYLNSLLLSIVYLCLSKRNNEKSMRVKPPTCQTRNGYLHSGGRKPSLFIFFTCWHFYSSRCLYPDLARTRTQGVSLSKRQHKKQIKSVLFRI